VLEGIKYIQQMNQRKQINLLHSMGFGWNKIDSMEYEMEGINEFIHEVLMGFNVIPSGSGVECANVHLIVVIALALGNQCNFINWYSINSIGTA